MLVVALQASRLLGICQQLTIGNGVGVGVCGVSNVRYEPGDDVMR